LTERSVLFDIGHPAHVHLFKNFIRYLKERRHNVIVVSRDKDVTNDLLKHYKIDSISLSTAGTGPLGLLGELTRRDFKIFKLHKKYHFEFAFGTSYSIAHLSALYKVRSFVFEEDDDDIVPVFTVLTYPFATGIVVPSCLRYKKWSKKRIVHDSYHELAYLHPGNFSPDAAVLKYYGLTPRNYIIVRNSALKAHHDFKIKGLIGETWDRVQNLIKDYTLVSSRENIKDQKIKPWDMHNLLAFSKMLISDSQSMTMEAAALGVPSIRYNSFVGRIAVLEEMEHKYGLTYGYRPGQEDKMLAKVNELLKERNFFDEWQTKRNIMLKEKINFLEWLINFFNSLN